MELLPDPGGLPVAKPSPTGHAAAAAHLQRQVLHRDASLEDEEDANRPLRLSRGLRPGNQNAVAWVAAATSLIRFQSSSDSKGLAMGAILPRDTHFYVEGRTKIVILLGSLSVTNEVRVELYYQAQYNQCVTIIDLRALTRTCGERFMTQSSECDR